MKKKILFLFVHLNYGGAEIGLLTTLKSLDKSRFDPIVVSIEKKGIVGEMIEKSGFKVIYLNDKARIFNIPLIPKIVRILRSEKPDILHTSLFYANFFGRIASLFKKPPIIVSEERSMYTEKKFYHVILDKILSVFTNKIIVCSKSVLDFTSKQEKIEKNKFHLIYNAVDQERFNIKEKKEELRARYGYPQEGFIIGTVGSLIPKKGHKFLIEATSALKGSIPELKLLLIGDGASREELRNQAEAQGAKANVEFLGAREDIPQLMKIMDVFVLPSLQEGFPRTMLEAMYMGIPVVASNISGIPEIIEEGKNGFLLTPGKFTDIMDRLKAIYSNPELRRSVGANARKKIESAYLPKDYVRELENLYEKLSNKKCR